MNALSMIYIRKPALSIFFVNLFGDFDPIWVIFLKKLLYFFEFFFYLFKNLDFTGCFSHRKIFPYFAAKFSRFDTNLLVRNTFIYLVSFTTIFF